MIKLILALALFDWQCVYNGGFTPNPHAEYTVLDLFEFEEKDVKRCKRPIAYFSAHYEDWRPDAKKLEPYKLRRLGHWPGEYYIKWNNPTVKNVMIDRMRLAQRKGFHGVDIDNVDGVDGRRYFAWLFKTAKSMGLRVGLKNFVEILGEHDVDFYVIEATDANELQLYKPYRHKPLLRMRYSHGAKTPSWMSEAISGHNGNKF